MGTRAAFFIGDFRDTEKREWLGCVAYDGYPDGLPELCASKTEAEFRAAIAGYSERDDFAKPTGPFPFPWQDDLCLTDCTYTWHEGEVWCEWDLRFVPLAKVWPECNDDQLVTDYPVTCQDIPAPGQPYDGSAPDSIILISA